MSISDELLSQFVRVTNDAIGYSGETTSYGTIVVYGTTTYVRLDGSDILTPIVSTTEVNNGERVIVRLKNHTATVTGNVDNPSIGKMKVGQLESSIEQTESSIRLEVQDEVAKLEASISVTAESISSIVANQNEFSEFKQTVEGFSFMGNGGTVKISGGDISLTGSISFGDLDDDVISELNAIDSTASSAGAIANSALSTANSANGTAASALSLANTAMTIAQSVSIPSYIKSTYIDKTTIESPTIIGGEIYAVGSDPTKSSTFTQITENGFYLYYATAKPNYNGTIDAKVSIDVPTRTTVRLILGSGDSSDPENPSNRFMINKYSYATEMLYYYDYNWNACGFNFSNTGLVTPIGKLSLTTANSNIIDLIYPIGSIYLAYNHTNPATLFGGTWVRISAHLLYATSASGVIGETGTIVTASSGTTNSATCIKISAWRRTA